MSKRLSNEDVISSFKKNQGEKYDYSQVKYVDYDTKIKIICPTHGAFFQRADHHRNGHECPACSGCKQHSTASFIEAARKIHGNSYIYSKTRYKNAKTKICIICPIHGEFYSAPTNHLSGLGCWPCAIVRISKACRDTKDEFIEKARKTHQNKYEYDSVNYINSLTKVEIFCNKHKSYFNQAPNPHIKGSGCPRCSHAESSMETFIQKFLDEHDIKYIKRYRPANLEFDMFIPDKNLAIECNGIYWHSELAGKDRKYHLNKLKMANSFGFRLINIFEHEIFSKPRIVKSRLFNILQLGKYKRYAKKCEVRPVDADICKKFLNKYHIQGEDVSFIKLGLFCKNRLVSVMTFCHNRKSLSKNKKDGEYELSRFCSLSHISIIGAAEKLFSFFEGNFNPKKVTSYEDRKWSAGELYLRLGFSLLRQSSPSYWYFKKLEVHHRSKFRKNLLKSILPVFDENKSEWENMKDNKWNRFWDCGNSVFEKNYA